MKLSDALSTYRAYRADLINERKSLLQQRDNALNKYKVTGSDEYSQAAAVLQLSIDANNEKFNANQDVLDNLSEQHTFAWNMEVARQQSDPENGFGATVAKIMTVAMRIMNGDRVPYADEKKLMEYDPKLYQSAKKIAMMHYGKERKEHDSLWDDENAKEYDPQGAADNAEAHGILPEIPAEEPA